MCNNNFICTRIYNLMLGLKSNTNYTTSLTSSGFVCINIILRCIFAQILALQATYNIAKKTCRLITCKR